MPLTTISECGRFVVVEGLHLDREVFDVLARWAAERGLRVQDAVQLAVCAFNDGLCHPYELRAPPSKPASSSRVLARSPLVDRIE